MPYIKKARDGMSKLLGAYQLENSARLAPVLGVSEATALRRIKKPEAMTLHELRRLNTHGHIPVDELRAALLG